VNIIKTASPTGGTALFYQGFPLVQPINLAVNVINLINNALLLAGAWMCWQAMPAGFKMVRTVTLVILAGIALWLVVALLTTTMAQTWTSLTSADKGVVIENILLAVFLGGVPTGILLFLFRNGR
jgi:hypothetical protein